MSLTHPVLSTIPNRYAFLQKIESTLTQRDDISLLLIDVVRFSDVSSGLGYQAGDVILGEIAQRLIRLMGSQCELGRISGDIFALVVPGRSSEAVLRRLYNHIVEHFKTPIAFDDHAFIADFNVGAVTNPVLNTDFHSLFTRAELALKQSKQNKYENFSFLTIKSDKNTSRSLTLKADLKRAFDNDELELYFQPKVRLSDLSIVGAECLLRWNHPLDGVIFPGPLLEAAESYNMMNNVGYWVLNHAFEAAQRMQALGCRIPLSVNMSPTQLYDIEFARNMQNLAEHWGISSDCIELELTEDIALNNSLIVDKQLSQIRHLGFRIAVDDFGKGYSNLGYIRDLKVDAIKIDKSFVIQLDDNKVNRAIIQATKLIADALGAEVIAEGVETLEHLHILRELDIRQGQGFLFSKAVPFNRFVELTQQEIAVGGTLAYPARGS